VKLYELIELGGSFVVEDHDSYLETGDTFVTGELMGQPISYGSEVCGCLIGTAAYACGERPDDTETYYTTGKRLYRALMRQVPAASEPVYCPAAAEDGNRCHLQPVAQLLSVAEHLHNYHDWPRQKIADWLKPIEDEYERRHPSVDVSIPVLKEVKS
jgi:hypothetical protein